MIEMKELECFVACADTLSFRQAGVKLFVSQSYVSKKMKSLEGKIGHELFIRKNQGVELTDYGRMVYGYAQTALEIERKLKSL